MVNIIGSAEAARATQLQNQIGSRMDVSGNRGVWIWPKCHKGKAANRKAPSAELVMYVGLYLIN